MSDLTPVSVFDIIGTDGFTRLVAAFYRRVPHSPELSPMYPADDLQGAEDRLRGFLIYRFGGPMTYIEERGHPALRMRHQPFHINRAARDAWVRLMDEALREVALPPEADTALRQLFEQVATFLINRAE